MQSNNSNNAYKSTDDDKQVQQLQINSIDFNNNFYDNTMNIQRNTRDNNCNIGRPVNSIKYGMYCTTLYVR